MNKTEFINIFRQISDLPSETDMDAVCSYLNETLQDEVDIAPDIFSRCLKISFDIFKHINEKETQKHLDSIMESINDAMSSPQDNSDEAKGVKSIHATERSSEHSSTRSDITKRREGLWQKLCSKKGHKRILGISSFIAACILLLPFIAAAAALCFIIYAVPMLSAVAITLIILVPTLFLAVLAIVALSYGIASLFTSPPIGIMEMGLGTVLFSISIALWAVNLRFFTFAIPFLFKKITGLMKKVFSRPVSMIFGKEAE